jgi:hypothetical protein
MIAATIRNITGKTIANSASDCPGLRLLPRMQKRTSRRRDRPAVDDSSIAPASHESYADDLAVIHAVECGLVRFGCVGQYARTVVPRRSAAHRGGMNKRNVATVLWFSMGWVLGSALAIVIGVPVIVGALLLAFASGALIRMAGRRLWSTEAPAPVAAPAGVTSGPLATE